MRVLHDAQEILASNGLAVRRHERLQALGEIHHTRKMLPRVEGIQDIDMFSVCMLSQSCLVDDMTLRAPAKPHS